RLLAPGPRTDIRASRLAGRSRYEELLEAGVRIYEWMPTTLHAKAFVVDGIWSSVGTMNFDNRSLALNDEVAMMVLDSAFGRQMDSVFRAALDHAEEVRLETFRQRGLIERIGEWGMRLVVRVL